MLIFVSPNYKKFLSTGLTNLIYQYLNAPTFRQIKNHYVFINFETSDYDILLSDFHSNPTQGAECLLF